MKTPISSPQPQPHKLLKQKKKSPLNKPLCHKTLSLLQTQTIFQHWQTPPNPSLQPNSSPPFPSPSPSPKMKVFLWVPIYPLLKGFSLHLGHKGNKGKGKGNKGKGNKGIARAFLALRNKLVVWASGGAKIKDFWAILRIIDMYVFASSIYLHIK